MTFKDIALKTEKIINDNRQCITAYISVIISLTCGVFPDNDYQNVQFNRYVYQDLNEPKNKGTLIKSGYLDKNMPFGRFICEYTGSSAPLGDGELHRISYCDYIMAIYSTIVKEITLSTIVNLTRHNSKDIDELIRANSIRYDEQSKYEALIPYVTYYTEKNIISEYVTDIYKENLSLKDFTELPKKIPTMYMNLIEKYKDMSKEQTPDLLFLKQLWYPNFKDFKMIYEAYFATNHR